MLLKPDCLEICGVAVTIFGGWTNSIQEKTSALFLTSANWKLDLIRQETTKTSGRRSHYSCVYGNILVQNFR